MRRTERGSDPKRRPSLTATRKKRTVRNMLMHTSSRRQTSSRRERKREGSDVLARRLHETFSISRFAAREALKGDTKVLSRSRPQGRSQESSNEAFSQNSKRGHTLAAVPRERSRAHVAACGTLSTWSSAESTDPIAADEGKRRGQDEQSQ